MILHNPWGLLVLLAVPAIIILYLLKQKHEDYVISSLYLWQNAVQDMEANAPWQKLKKNILMYLQIFAVILLALILSGPFLQSGADKDKAAVIVMDCSLSMQSADIKPNRFEEARKDALKLVEASDPDTEFSLIASESRPYIVLNKATDRNKVMQEIKALKATDTAEDLEGTIELLQSLLCENSQTRVSWFSDGINPVKNENVDYYSYGRNRYNYAVTLLSQRKLENSNSITALSRIANFSPTYTELDVSLYADGNFFDARRINVGAGESENLYWSEIPDTVTKLECRIDTEDILEKDNTSGVMVYSNKVKKVLLVSQKNIFLEKILNLMPDVELYRTDMEGADEIKGYDLYIFDSEMPDELPEDGHAILFNPPGNNYFSVAGESEKTEIHSVKHKIYSSLTQDISFNALKTDRYQLPVWGNPLMENDSGTVAFEGFAGKNRIVVFGFDLHETNLPLQPFFPVIMTKVVQELLPGGSSQISAVNAGDSIELSVDPEANEVSVMTPDGNKVRIAPPFPANAYDETTQIGTYMVEQQLENGVIQQVFFVNAPSEKEFTASETAASAEKNSEGSQTVGKSGGLSLKMPLLWLLLVIIIIEWWVYTNGTSI